MKYINRINSLGLVAVLLSSCVSIDEKPDSYQTSNAFYKNESDAIGAVTAVYSALTNGTDNLTLYNRGIQVATEMSTDDSKAGPRAGNANVQALSNLTNDASNDRQESIWRDSYNLINYANIAIDNIAKIPSENINESVRQRSINEAKFLRALAYFNLVRWFKYVPLVLHETTTLSSSSLNVSQASEEEVYAQIIKDLQDAEALPSPKDYKSVDAGRASSGSAKALLAKVYLTREEWKLAADKAKEIIDNSWYDLFPNFSDVFDKATKNGIEHIFSIQFKGETGSIHRLAFASTPYGLEGISGNYTDAVNLQSDLYGSFSVNDTRKAVTFATQYVSPATGIVYTVDEPHFCKYYDPTAVGGQNNSSRNIPVLRYAEVLLIYAEALNELNGPTKEAYDAVDRVRARAGIETLTAENPSLSKDDFREAVFQERRKEFVSEYKRWFDLSRRGAAYYVAKLKAAGKNNAQPKHIHFPIPQRELDLNPNLHQNPDWAN